MTDPVNSATDVGQTDYMKVFMQELAYQDPLKPIDNREFMAQMAQFSALQQAVETSKNVAQLVEAASYDRGISLLGKYVRVPGLNTAGKVEAIFLNDNKISEIRVAANGSSVKVGLDQVTEISNT